MSLYGSTYWVWSLPGCFSVIPQVYSTPATLASLQFLNLPSIYLLQDLYAYVPSAWNMFACLIPSPLHVLLVKFSVTPIKIVVSHLILLPLLCFIFAHSPYRTIWQPFYTFFFSAYLSPLHVSSLRAEFFSFGSMLFISPALRTMPARELCSVNICWMSETGLNRALNIRLSSHRHTLPSASSCSGDIIKLRQLT